MAEGFGALGKKVTNEQQLSIRAKISSLRAVWEEIKKSPDQNFVVEVVIPADASPLAIASKAGDAVGEDEICNPHWPPSELF